MRKTSPNINTKYPNTEFRSIYAINNNKNPLYCCERHPSTSATPPLRMPGNICVPSEVRATQNYELEPQRIIPVLPGKRRYRSKDEKEVVEQPAD